MRVIQQVQPHEICNLAAQSHVDRKSGRTVVRIDSRSFRPAEVDTLLGDASRARHELGWAPTGSFDDLVAEMLASCLNNLWYRERNPDVFAAQLDPYDHWLARGADEGRLPCDDPLSLLDGLLEERASRSGPPNAPRRHASQR